MATPRNITNEDVTKAQLESDYYWMLTHWGKHGIKAPPTHALRNYAFREYKRIKQECQEQIDASGKANDTFLSRKMTWHNMTIFLHCIVTHPLYLSEEHQTHTRQQLKLPPLVQQLMELN
jgi:hypothetical protein